MNKDVERGNMKCTRKFNWEKITENQNKEQKL